ncbi:HlyD family secretion protein [Luteimonas salinilitoris]|uniref:HlyD family secretion protein n=1 Tax=Luteimonas salinilitoris TaxID=3237697 RepID=A0ABV4HT42_9GAMM
MVEGLFRDEVLEARRQDWLGSVHLSTSRLGWPMTVVAALAMLALLLILAFGSYTRKERVQGRLVPEGGLQTVAAPAAGVLVRRFVAEGDAVTRGQPLLEISPDIHTPQSDGPVGEQLAAGLDRRHLRLQRDLAEMENAVPRQRDALTRRIESLRHQLASADAEFELRRRQAEGARRMLERLQPLTEQQIVSEVQLQQYEEQALGTEAQRELARRTRLEVERDLAQARQELDELPLRNRERRSAVEHSLAEIEQSLVRNQAQRSVLVLAPGPGTVSGLAADAGQAIAERQRLLSIVPRQARLLAELWVPSRAVGPLSPGDRVALRYDAFPYQTHGQRYGRIVEIAGSTFAPDEVRTRTGIDLDGPVYRVLAALDRQDVTTGDRALPLRVGMRLDADLLLERRRLYRLVLAPLGDGDTEAAPSGRP